MTFTIKDIFKEEDLKQKADGNYQTECPSCGLQGGRTEGFILFPQTNTAYCHSSQKHFNLLETIALKNKLITCIEGRENGEKTSILNGELFNEVLDFIKENYSEKQYDEILIQLNLRRRIQSAGTNRLISEFAQELGEVLKRKQIIFYRSDINELVEIGKIKEPDGTETENGFITLEPNRFVTLIERYFRPFSVRRSKTGENYYVTTSIPGDVAAKVLVSSDFIEQMPVIKRIFKVQVPILYNGELTFPNKGYDKRFGSWLPYNAPKITDANMSLEKAKEVIDSLYEEFCFQEEQDRINAKAALITPALRGIFTEFNTRTPLFIYRGNRERVGKDYCAGVTGITYEGEAVEANPISNKEKGGNSNEELRKKITSTMLQGKNRFHSSNNKGHIDNAIFESVITAHVWEDRLLGKNQNVVLQNELDFSISANMNTTMTPDLMKRSVTINLFFDEEDINQREFKISDLHGYVKKNREVVLSAIYSLIKNWVDKGKPNGTALFSSFHEWASVCGGIMEAAGYGNPCTPKENEFGVALDTETEEMKQFFELMLESSNDSWITKTEMLDLLKESKEPIFPYLDFDKPGDRAGFAKRLERFVGRILSDIQLVLKPNGEKRAARRAYKFCKVPSKPVKSDDLSQNNDFGKSGKSGKELDSAPKRYISGFGTVVEVLPNLPNLPKNESKSDREVQFWEAEECKGIKATHSKDDVLAWVQANPGKSFKELYSALGVGSLKFKGELLGEKKIVQTEDRLEAVLYG